MHPEDSGNLECNTEKDKFKLHRRTAGIIQALRTGDM